MSRREIATALTLVALVAVSLTPARAQTFTPQSLSGLTVTFSSEKMGGSRVLVLGEVRNSTNAPAERVTVMVEGLDETGKVVSRGRAYVHGTVPSRGSASFEVRLLASGAERRYRAQIEAFQFVVGN